MQSRRIEKISKQTLQPSREVIEMQNRIGRMTTWASVVVVMGLLLLYSGTALSAPREVTLFPDSAQVMETTKVKLQTEGKYLKKAVFVLPAQADPDSLVTQVPEGLKLKIEDQTWRQIVRQDDGEILKLRKQVEKVRNDRRSLQAAIQSLNTQIQFWQLQTKAKMKTLNDTHNMSAAIGRNMKKTYEDKLNRELELEKMDKIIKELQEELDRTVGKKETAWEVAVLLSGTQATEATLTYT
jgi:predicted RNase H-like nuclease (RuvC/YqgF family)